MGFHGPRAIEDGLDGVERRGVGAVADEAADATYFARERVLANHLGRLVDVVKLKGNACLKV